MDRDAFLLELIEKIYAAGAGDIGWEEIAQTARKLADRDPALFRVLVPHLQRATAVRNSLERLHRERQLARRALDFLARGAVILDDQGEISYVNRRMREFLSVGDGVLVRDRRLCFADRSGQAALESALTSADGEDAGAALKVPRPSLAPPYEVMLIPLPANRGPRGGSVRSRGHRGWLVLVTDPDRDRAEGLKGLRSIHGLTDAEAEVTDHLVAGKSLEEIAESRGTTLNTVKTQVRLVYQKVGVSTRAELVRRLSGLETGEGWG